MNSFDWLSHLGIPQVDNFDIVEVKFKGGRKEYFRNVDYVSLNTGDPVVVDVPSGHHIGYVSLQGELVRLQMQKRKIRNDDNITRIYRLANEKDIEKWEEAKNREIPTLYRCKQIVDELGLQMKMSDVEYQADNSKATFYYSAEDRVDFRELIKILAGEFKIRVEMRQISLRQEAGRLGGIGVCGRELCCSTWLVDFKNVTTSAARYQNLSLNPSKLSGQCGRLKCCLNYELDTYMEAIKDIPSIDRPLQTEQGPAKLQKTDIFRKLMWFSYNNDNDWHSITCERVKEIQDLNEKGVNVFNLQVDKADELEDLAAQSTRELELLDKKFAKKKKKKKKRTKDFKPGEAEQKTNSNPSAAPKPNRVKDESSPAERARPARADFQEKNPSANPQPNRENRRKKKPRNRPNPNQKPSTNSQGAEPKNPPSQSGDNSQENKKRKFPPRRNQNPNKGSNE
ncbi:regulatory iron-sulfur-containing complex subunit RicT [Algoriphagus confluentis]